MADEADLLQPPRLVDDADLPRVPRQARGRAMRAALLAAALRLFGARGYEAIGVEEIATQAGTGVGSFYAYFRGKQQILLVLLQEYLGALWALDLMATELGADPPEAIERALRRALAPDRAYAGLWRAWREAVLTRPELRPIDGHITRRMQAYVAAMIERARPTGRVRPDLDVGATAYLANALMLQLAQAGELEDEDAVLAAAARMLSHAIFVDAPRPDSPRGHGGNGGAQR
jgi:AcrR family transcriptional regulator